MKLHEYMKLHECMRLYELYDFQCETNRNINVLFRKSEINSNEQTKEEIDRRRKENGQLKLDNADLTQRLNNQVHRVADLNAKVKATVGAKSMSPVHFF